MVQWFSPPVTLVEGTNSISSTSYFLNPREKKNTSNNKSLYDIKRKTKTNKGNHKTLKMPQNISTSVKHITHQ